MRYVILAFVAICSLPSVGAAQNYITCYFYPGPDSGDIVVATVTRVFDEKATEEHPFRLRMKIEEVLRGTTKPGYTLATWPLTPDAYAGSLPRDTPDILATPKLDTKLILWGFAPLADTNANPNSIFRISGFHRHIDTPENRAWTAKMIREGEVRRVEYEKMVAMEKRFWESNLDAWQGNFTAKKISELAQKADVIVVGNESGYSSNPGKDTRFTFRVSKVLKGSLRQTFVSDKTWIYVTTEGTLTQLLQRQGHQLPEYDWILFLTHQGLVQSPALGMPDHYQVLDNNTAILAVDPSHVEAVSKALGK